MSASSPSRRSDSITLPPPTLPASPTPLLGRANALHDIVALLAAHERVVRWLTLTGPGGIGKTRLAIEVARTLDRQPDRPFPDGIWFVDLLPIAHAEAVLPAICLGIRGTGSGALPPVEAIADAIGEGRALLVLDNGEHLTGAAREVDSLLDRCPGLSVLLTSREIWHLRREHVREVAPLQLPDTPTHAALMEASATRLFIERAHALDAFTLSDANAESIVALCRWLEGNPLAIELAAARSNLFSPTTLIAMADERLALLTWPAADLPTRHRSFTALLDWSIDLLSDAERTAFMRLSVFTGSFSHEAAIAVMADEGHDALAILASLVDKHLVQRVQDHGGSLRVRLLETVRDYALGLLQQSNEEGATRNRHLAFFLAQAVESTRDFHTSRWQGWTQRLEMDHDNLRAAIRWSIASGQIEIEVRLLLAMESFWLFHGHMREALRRLQDLESRMPDEMDVELRYRILIEMGMVAVWMMQGFNAIDSFQRGLALAIGLGDPAKIALGKCWVAVAVYQQGDSTRARALCREAIADARPVNAWVEIGFAYRNLTFISLFEPDSEHDRLALAAELDEAIRYLRLHDNARNIAVLLMGQMRLNPALPTSLLLAQMTESLTLADRVQDQMVIEFTTWSTAWLLRDLLPPDGVAELMSLVDATQAGIRRNGNFGIVSSFGDPEAEAAMRKAMANAHRALGTNRFQDIVERGRALPLHLIPKAMLRLVESISPTTHHDGTTRFTLVPEPTPSPASTLSRRERQVLALLAQGLSNKEMGQALSLSDRTVERHIASIYRKLGVRRRGDAAAFAERHGLT